MTLGWGEEVNSYEKRRFIQALLNKHHREMLSKNLLAFYTHISSFFDALLARAPPCSLGWGLEGRLRNQFFSCNAHRIAVKIQDD